MPAKQPAIPATSGGLKPGARTRLEFGLFLHQTVELPGVSRRAPKVTCWENGDVLEERWEAAVPWLSFTNCPRSH